MIYWQSKLAINTYLTNLYSLLFLPMVIKKEKKDPPFSEKIAVKKLATRKSGSSSHKEAGGTGNM